MELFNALESFSSLSQETRLRVLRYLIEYGCDGAMPSQIAKDLKIPDNTLSFHLSHMTKAQLLTSKKSGRTITYYVNADHLEDLIDFMRDNCCAKMKPTKTSKERKCTL